MKTTLAVPEPIHGPAVPIRASAAHAEVAEGESVHRVTFTVSDPEKKSEAVAVVVRCATPDGSALQLRSRRGRPRGRYLDAGAGPAARRAPVGGGRRIGRGRGEGH